MKKNDRQTAFSLTLLPAFCSGDGTMTKRCARIFLRNLQDSIGFTLLEVLSTVLILSIIAAFAIPAFSSWLPDYRLKAATGEIFSHFQQAKIAAAKNGNYSTICFHQPLGSTTYSYVIFIDEDNDLEFDSGEKVLIRCLWGAGDEYQGVSFDSSMGGGDGVTFSKNDDGIPAIAFQPSGIPISNTGGLGMGSVYLKNTKGKKARVVLSTAGSIRVEYPL